MATTTLTTLPTTDEPNVSLFFRQITLLFIRYGIISIIVSLLIMRLLRKIHQWSRSKLMINKFSGINVPFWRIPIGNINILLGHSWTAETIVDSKFFFLVECFFIYLFVTNLSMYKCRRFSIIDGNVQNFW